MVKLSKQQLFFAIAIFVTLFLFYIDEGYYNFQWMKSWGNWIVFGIYTTVIFVIQNFILLLLKKFFRFKNEAFISIIVGIPLAFFVLFRLVFNS